MFDAGLDALPTSRMSLSMGRVDNHIKLAGEILRTKPHRHH